MALREFSFDIFFSHGNEDVERVRPLAERLRLHGLRVWFSDWVQPARGKDPSIAIEHALDRSRTLVLCLSEAALTQEWLRLESQTFRFRDPLNADRRFVLLQLDDTAPPPSLGRFPHISWNDDAFEMAFRTLLEACKPETERRRTGHEGDGRQIHLSTSNTVAAYVFSRDLKRVVTAESDKTIRLWEVGKSRLVRTFRGHTERVRSVAWSSDEQVVLTGSGDTTIRVWNIATGPARRVLSGHSKPVNCIAVSGDQTLAVSGSNEPVISIWDVPAERQTRALKGHYGAVWSVALSGDEQRLASGSDDKTARIWNIASTACEFVLEGHTGAVGCVAWSTDDELLLSGSEDMTVRVWNTKNGHCVSVLKGHTGSVTTIAWVDRRHIVSGSIDKTVRLWDLLAGRCVRVFEGHTEPVVTVTARGERSCAMSGDSGGGIKIWDLSGVPLLLSPNIRRVSSVEQVEYTNAKVLLVGESGAGKTGLSKVLAGQTWEPSDSTVGVWATQWKLPVGPANGMEREIWLWDFGGQADQRLIHQLYMDETALVVLVFDGQKEDVLETLGQWDRDMSRASRSAFGKLLVAGRVDAGGLRISRTQLEKFVEERGFAERLFETSAKFGTGCDDLKEAIRRNIRWDEIPWRSSPLLFKRLKEEIIRLKDEGRVLMRFNELRETLQLRMSGKTTRFTDKELKAVIGLLAGPGVVWELQFGSWVLLQPERINAYAQAVIQTIRADEQERGCLLEERILNGALTYQSSLERLTPEDERFILLAMHQTLVERGLCLREHTDRGALLVFPSYYRRERPELVGNPAVLVSYRFNGFVDDVYATLVVRLHHTLTFEQHQLWRYAADFRTFSEKRALGVRLTRLGEGAGELEVYFDPLIPPGEKIIFSIYIHQHLLQNAQDVVRLRHYVCPLCGTPVKNREVAMQRLSEWLEQRDTNTSSRSFVHRWLRRRGRPTIVCVQCEERIPLWDDLEQHFASPEIRERVRELEEQVNTELDNESKERALVGDVISTVALAGQLSREFNVSDHGIDMEIEFKSDAGEATGQKLYLQLKSGDSYLHERKGDGIEVFRIKDERHARYWEVQRFPVLLVIRNSDGEIRWMEIREYLRQKSRDGSTAVRSIEFRGERFDVMSVRRWRDRVLRGLLSDSRESYST